MDGVMETSARQKGRRSRSEHPSAWRGARSLPTLWHRLSEAMFEEYAYA